MATISGKLGFVNGQSTVRNWKVSTSAALAKYIASNTKGMTGHLAGNKDWSGSYAAYGHTPVVMPGDAFAFSGTIDNAKGCQGTAIVDSIELTVNIESGETIAHVVNFSGNGALVIGGAVAVTADATLPAAYSSIGCKVTMAPYAATPTYAEIVGVKTFTLKITAANVAYVDASTGGLVKRTAGNLSASVSIAVNGETSALTNLTPIINTEQFLRLYVTATTYWELMAVRIDGVGDISVDIESAAIVSGTISAQFTSHYVGAASALTEGTIKNPAGTTWWPAAA